MSGETVVYRNEMNLVPLRRFTSTEVDLFFTLCNKLKEQDTRKVTIPFEELKYLSNYYTRSQERFINDLEHVYDKMLNLTYIERNGRSFEKFVLFTSYKIDLDEECLSISINSDLKHILNSITADFTKFELREMTHLKSTYAKNMFRLLKQYKHTGYVKMNLDDFKNRLDVPKTYQMNDITKRVLKPIVNELSAIFNNLSINKIKAKKGRKIEWLEFTFEAEKRIHNKRQPQMANIGKSRQYISREKTPKWLEERTYEKPTHNEYDPQLEKEREAFLRQLEVDWEE
ncbi:replication initiation protein [Staphylococcus epidermidis]|jgi:plasmid replication initiation protein|uniref:replication initiation protein n=1 Tax=Staphylococcus epidermidis TaxID=1282 RepID=UPI001C0134A2|nr:RepB family plasmid replication initiator protein [Rhizobium sp. CSW-27]MBT9373455.1 RepB family plasmid replication initiator protein [Rhizobium sp. CSW-27]